MTEKVFMHVSGYKGAGKSTLMSQIDKKYYKLIDTDDFLNKADNSATRSVAKYCRNCDAQESQAMWVKFFNENMTKHINTAVKKSKKPVILFGMNGYNPEYMMNTYIDVDAVYKVWLDTSLKTSFERTLKRQLEFDLKNLKSVVRSMEKMTEEEEYERFQSIYSMKSYYELWGPLEDIYKAMGYHSVSPKNIIAATEEG